MSKIVWDDTGKRLFSVGVDHGVLYPITDGTYDDGVAWNGLISVQESPTGGELNPQWADNIKYINIRGQEQFGATIEAFTYPDEFAECDGSRAITTGVYIGQQSRKSFGFSYRSKIGNDVDGEDHGYEIHLVYGASANPSEKTHETMNENPDAATFSWDIETIPVPVVVVDGDDTIEYKPTAHLVIDSTKFDTPALKTKLKALEDVLYGTDAGSGSTATAPRLPLPGEIITLMA